MRSTAILISKIAHGSMAALLAATLTIGTGAQACTSFIIRTQTGGVVYGRTMEFGFDMKSAAILIPRHFAPDLHRRYGKPGALKWASKYAAVGLNRLGDRSWSTVQREEFAGGILYFPGYAGYADAAKTDPAKSLAPGIS